MNTKEIITSFYEAFSRADAEGMVKHYSDEIIFEDPAFGILKGEDAKNMWRMLLSNATDLKVTFSNVKAEGESGTADWEAIYTFSKTGRKVHNKIHAAVQCENGKIVKHTDEFNFYKWSRMALGPFGLFFGFTPFVKKKVKTTAKKALKHYIKHKK